MEEGSAVAQALSFIEGIESLSIEAHQMAVTRDPEVPWHILVAEVSAVVKELLL
jgi:hypothetical protein